MPSSKKTFMVMAAALLLGWSMPGPAPAAEGEEPAGGATVATPETPTAPPKNLRLVGDHWTPYAPPDPESFPAGATVHIIVSGETLWGLADLTYNNPYLWPQLWNENRYISDSHWIYPGDPLLLPPRPVVVTQAGPDARAGVPTEILPQGQEGAPHTDLEPLEGPGTGDAETPAPETPLQAEAAPSQAAPEGPSASRHPSADGFSSGRLVERDNLRCSGYITEDAHRGELFIAENDEPGYENVTLGSIIYLNRGSKKEKGEALQPGEVFGIIEREGKVLHPVTGRSQGLYYRRLGEVRVLKVLEDTAIATVSFACDDIRVGDELVAVDHQPVPEGPVPPFDRLRVEPNGKPTGYVIHTKDLAVRVATGDIVHIDLGREDGVSPGAFLTAFAAVRSGKLGHMPDYHFKYQNEVFSSADLHWDDGRDEYPSLPVGQMIVISSEAHTSTAKVLHAVREMSVGTVVEVD